MKDILFIIHDNHQDYNQFPLGIGYLAAILRQRGYSVEVYCMDIYHYTNEQLANKLDKEEYKIIGVGFLAPRFKETILDLCKTINRHKKDARLILGGHCPSAIPEYILKKTQCDGIVVGEAENCIENVLLNKQSLYYSKPVTKLDSIPFPAWDLFPMKEYTQSMFFQGMTRNDRVMQILSSRGCINKCTFCYRMKDGIRLRSWNNVIEEMQLLNELYGVNVFQFQDELFLISKKRLLQFKESL